MNSILVKQALTNFLNEDLGFGDPTAALFDHKQIQGDFIAKQAGRLCGQNLPQQVYDLLGDGHYTPFVPEGAYVEAGTKIGSAIGASDVLLAGERTILNLMQRQSGIATATSLAIKTLADPTIKIADTRKTMPGLRIFDKYAVTVGGGYNHRFGLDHGLMLKDNHIAAAGGIQAAIHKAQKHAGPLMRIEIEVETKFQLLAAIAANADVIMLDNQTPNTLKEWCPLIPKGIVTEVSGGITVASLAAYRNCGADFISLGYLTNGVTPLDISFNLKGVVKS